MAKERKRTELMKGGKLLKEKWKGQCVCVCVCENALAVSGHMRGMAVG